MTEVIYREPGAGAIEFASTFTEGLTIQQAAGVISSLMRDDLQDKTGDKRIKRCGYCGYHYRDKTRPNNSRTCSRECKIGLDTLNRAKKRSDELLLSPKKKTKREEYYTYWLEYPFWIDEYEMLKQSWKNDVPYAPDKIIEIDSAKQRDEALGGKRKTKRTPSYNS